MSERKGWPEGDMQKWITIRGGWLLALLGACAGCADAAQPPEEQAAQVEQTISDGVPVDPAAFPAMAFVDTVQINGQSWPCSGALIKDRKSTRLNSSHLA